MDPGVNLHTAMRNRLTWQAPDRRIRCALHDRTRCEATPCHRVTIPACLPNAALRALTIRLRPYLSSKAHRSNCVYRNWCAENRDESSPWSMILRGAACVILCDAVACLGSCARPGTERSASPLALIAVRVIRGGWFLWAFDDLCDRRRHADPSAWSALDAEETPRWFDEVVLGQGNGASFPEAE